MIYFYKNNLCDWKFVKINECQNILKPLWVEVENIKMETTEIQADTVEEVAMHSAKEASDKLKCTVLKNDTGLYVEALNESICVL